jgi:hypothetical protein
LGGVPHRLAAQEGVVGRRVPRRRLGELRLRRAPETDLHRRGHAAGNVGLHGEYVLDRSVERLRPTAFRCVAW